MALSLDAPKKLPRVFGDIERVRQILGNLVDNAYHYTPVNGTIKVQIHSNDGTEVQVDVEDNGVGISADQVPHIFDRFYRADPSRARDSAAAGLGLGLAICAWIAVIVILSYPLR